MRSMYRLAGAAAFMTMLAPAFAGVDTALSDEEDLDELFGGEEFVSIATGSSKPIYKAPAVATVITAKDIEQIGARNLNEALETVPGLHVAPSALNRMEAVYSIRGIHTGFNPQVLLLLDGIPLQYSNTGGRPQLFDLSVASIERIEVIRGPGSAVYGADAYSGVINVITKSADTIDGTEMGGRIGSFNARDLWLQHGDQWSGMDVVFGLAYQRTDGDSGRVVSSDLQSAFDTAFATSASLAPGPLSTNSERLETRFGLKNDNWHLNLWSWMQDDTGVGAGAAQALDPNGTQSDKIYRIDIAYKTADLVADWNFNTRLSHTYYDTQAEFNLLPSGAVVPIGADGNLNFAAPVGMVSFPDGLIGQPGGEGQDSQLEVVATYSGMLNHHWRMAGGIRRQLLETKEFKNFGPGVIDGTQPVVNGTLTDVTGTAYVYTPDSSRTNYHLSVQDEWQFAPDWELTAGIRYDGYSDFGSTVNPRVALVWATSHALTTKLLYGSAFRAPSFTELYFANNPVSLGNSTLQPEIIDTLELAFNYRPSPNLQGNLSLFAYEAKDLIEYVADSGATTQTAQNARDQDGYGFELEADWKVSRDLRINANYAWQHSEDASTGVDIHDAPGQQLYFNAHWRVAPQWSVNSQLNWVGGRKRASGDTRDEIDDYTLVNLTLKRQGVVPGLDLTLSILNLFDENAREPSDGTIADDYPLEGRSVWVAAHFGFE
ncbi:MAG: TonB-dependent receptor [Gammaproteobacteria bacterium]|nr:TonB-dependent receptor [Gammaproteobacteria bacterium]